MFDEKLIVKRVPKWIINRTRWYMEERMMSLSDAFIEAVREYPKPSKELRKAFYHDDFREYIPSAYLKEYLDFEKYPLPY